MKEDCGLNGWYPLMLNISDKLCAVLGGGAVAERKTAGLLSAGGRVRVISPSLVPGLEKLVREGRIEWRKKEAEIGDLEGAMLVFAATDDPETNQKLIEMAKMKGMLVNDAGQGDTGNFIVPAVLRRGDFVIAVSSSGSSPALAARAVRELAGRYGPEYADYAAASRVIRETVRAQVANPAQRRELLLEASEEAALREWLDMGKPGPEETLEWLRFRVQGRQIAEKRGKDHA